MSCYFWTLYWQLLAWMHEVWLLTVAFVLFLCILFCLIWHTNKTFYDLILTHFNALLVVCAGAWLEEDLSNALFNYLCQIISICNILHACKHILLQWRGSSDSGRCFKLNPFWVRLCVSLTWEKCSKLMCNAVLEIFMRSQQLLCSWVS